MRDALSLLDQCAGPEGPIGEAQVLDALGLAGNLETGRLMEHIGAGDTAAALETLARLYGSGKEIGSLLNELSGLTRDLLIRKTAPQGGAALLNGGYDESTLRRLSGFFQTSRLAQMLGLLQQTVAGLARSGNRRTDAELCLIRLCEPALDESAAGLNARLVRVEELLSKGPAAGAPPRPEAGEERREAPPAVPEEDRPPWEGERPPLPDEPGDPVGYEPPAPPEVSAAASAPPVPQPAADLWPGLVAALRGKVPMGEYSFLNNPSMVQGRLEGSVLTLWVESDFVKNMVGKPAVLEAVSSAASAMSGASVGCRVMVGKPPAPAARPAPAEHDKLDDLLALKAQFDNIIIQE